MAASAQGTPDTIKKYPILTFEELKVVEAQQSLAQANHNREIISHHYRIAEAYRDAGKTKIALGFMQKAAESISSLLAQKELAVKSFDENKDKLDDTQRADIESVLNEISRIIRITIESFDRKGRTLSGMEIKFKNTSGEWTNCKVLAYEFDTTVTTPATFLLTLENTTTSERTKLSPTVNFDERLRDTDVVLQASRNEVRLTFKYGLAEKEIMNVINRFPAADAIGTIDTAVNINGGASDTYTTYTHFTFFDRDEDPSLADIEKPFFHPAHQFTVETKRFTTQEKDGSEKTILKVIGIEPVGFSIQTKFQKDLNISFSGKELTEELAAKITEKLLFLHQHGIQPDKVREKEPKATKIGWFNSSSTDRRVARLVDDDTTLPKDEEKTDAVRAKIAAEEAGVTKPGLFARAMNWFGQSRIGKWLPAFMFANSAIAVGGTTNTDIVNRPRAEEPTEPRTPTRWDRFVQRAGETRLGKWFPSLFANNKLIMSAANPTPPADNSDIATHTPNTAPTKISKKKMGLVGLAAAAGLAALFGVRQINNSPDLPQDASMGLLSNDGTTNMIDAGISARQAAQAAQTNYTNAVAAHGAQSSEALTALTTAMDASTAVRVVASNEADASFAAMDAIQVAQTNYTNAIASNGADSPEAKAAATDVKNAQAAQQQILATIAAANDTTAIPNGAETAARVAAPVAANTRSAQGPAAIVLPVNTDSGDVNGGTAAHPDRHNDSLERFFVHGGRRVIQLANTGLTSEQETRAAGTIGHLLQQHTDTYLASHPSQAHRFGQIHHGDHGNMTVELATRPHGHGTQEVFHIQLHRADRQGADHVVLDLNIPKDEINSLLNSHGHHGIDRDSHGNGHRFVQHAAPAQHAGTALHVNGTAGHTATAQPHATVRTAAPRGRNERLAVPPVAPVAIPVIATTPAVDHTTNGQLQTAAAVAPTPAPIPSADAGIPNDAPTPTVNTAEHGQTNGGHTEEQNPAEAPAAQAQLPATVRPAPTQPIEQVATSRQIERTIDSFDHMSAYQKEALTDFILAFNERIPLNLRPRPEHSFGTIDTSGPQTFGTVGAAIEYDSQDRPTLKITLIGVPGTERETTLRAEIPFTVVRRADGSIDIETTEQPTILPSTPESVLTGNMRTSRRVVETLLSNITGDPTFMAREGFAPERDPIGPVDSRAEINRRVGTTMAGFSVQPATDEQDRYHLDRHNGGIYTPVRIGAHTPMDRALRTVLNAVNQIIFTPRLSLHDDRRNEDEVINEADQITITQPYQSHLRERDAVINALVGSIRDHLNVRAFGHGARTPATNVATPPTAPAPTQNHSDPLGLGNLGLKAENTVAHSEQDVAIAADTAAYEALMRDIADHFGHSDPSQQA